MNEPAQIILASASPRRRELLSQIGVRVMVQSVDIDETQKHNEPVMAYVQRLAMEKAQRGFDTIKNENKLPVLGSDTIVEIDGLILGKPENRQQAKKMLQQLSAKKHTVHTSVAIVTEGKVLLIPVAPRFYLEHWTIRKLIFIWRLVKQMTKQALTPYRV